VTNCHRQPTRGIRDYKLVKHQTMKTNDELELETVQDPAPKEKEVEKPESVVSKPEDLGEGDNDPLDEIEDSDALRLEAKKFRAIAKRHRDAKVEKPKVDTTEFVKKSDFELVNQKKAIKLATDISEQDSDEVKTAKQDMLENWDEVRQFYTPRRGKSTPEEVLEDIKDAYLIFDKRRVKKEEKPDASELKETKVVQGTANKPAPVAKGKSLDIKLPKPPTEWYT
jgi:hypothetical protein